MPWYYFHNGNFGDELNVDLGIALLGDQSAQNEGRHLTRTTDASLNHSWLWTTTQKDSVLRKVLAIGSVLGDAKKKDVLLGVGAKPEQSRLLAIGKSGTNGSMRTLPATAASNGADDLESVVGPELPEGMLAGLRNKKTTIRALRGLLTCGLLQRHGVVPGRPGSKCPTALGDPALIAPFVIPSWRAFRWMPARHVSGQPMLCVVPHMDDGRLRFLAHVEAYHAPCSLAPRNRTNIRVLSPLMPPFMFATALQTCDLVVASAMHGLIAADALRVPAVWMDAVPTSQRLTSRYEHKESPYKYLDYFSGVGKPPARVRSLDAALKLLWQQPYPSPRLSVAKLRDIATRHISAFPFETLCKAKDK